MCMQYWDVDLGSGRATSNACTGINTRANAETTLALDAKVMDKAHHTLSVQVQALLPRKPQGSLYVLDLDLAGLAESLIWSTAKKSNPPETPDRRPRQQIMPGLLMRCVNGNQEHWFQRSRVIDEELIYFRTMESFIFYSWASDKNECRDPVAISEKRLVETPGTEKASDELPPEGTCSYLSVLSDFVCVGDGSYACMPACICILYSSALLVSICLTGEQLRCRMSWQLP
ncbi:hypothetical protein LB504_001720 [Fusarium proliferatum]|nr:hypothetical protein LB504_001720 [Fusarium proliferatum]